MSRASELADAITPSKDNVPELGDLLDAAAELRRLDRVNAELVEAMRFYANPGDYKAPFTGGLGKLWHDCGETARAALTSATKEQQK